MLTLKTSRAGIAQAGVQPLTIVPDLPVVTDGEPSLRAGSEGRGRALGLEGAPEGFHQGVVVAIAGATHANDDAVLGEQGQVIMTGVLAALVGIVQQVAARLALSQGQAQRVLNQRLGHIVSHRPAHHPAREDVQHSSQVQKAFLRVDGGDIRLAA